MNLRAHISEQMSGQAVPVMASQQNGNNNSNPLSVHLQSLGGGGGHCNALSMEPDFVEVRQFIQTRM